jgi:hypothetical protein
LRLFVLTSLHRRLENCGHRCLAKCHSDSMHRAFRCPNTCERLFKPCGHECPKDCSDPCGLCNTIVNGVLLPCEHYIDQIPCHMSQHASDLKCVVQVPKRVPGCDHILTVPCYRDVTSEAFRCPVQCTALLECGHPCEGTCGTCNTQAFEGQPPVVKHSECSRICGRRYGTCQHTCEKICHGGKDCGLCSRPCQVNLHYPFVCHESYVSKNVLPSLNPETSQKLY